jgi:hypothetical protein
VVPDDTEPVSLDRNASSCTDHNFVFENFDQIPPTWVKVNNSGLIESLANELRVEGSMMERPPPPMSCNGVESKGTACKWNQTGHFVSVQICYNSTLLQPHWGAEEMLNYTLLVNFATHPVFSKVIMTGMGGFEVTPVMPMPTPTLSSPTPTLSSSTLMPIPTPSLTPMPTQSTLSPTSTLPVTCNDAISVEGATAPIAITIAILLTIL